MQVYAVSIVSHICMHMGVLLSIMFFRTTLLQQCYDQHLTTMNNHGAYKVSPKMELSGGKWMCPSSATYRIKSLCIGMTYYSSFYMGRTLVCPQTYLLGEHGICVDWTDPVGPQPYRWDQETQWGICRRSAGCHGNRSQSRAKGWRNPQSAEICLSNQVCKQMVMDWSG